ncbi:hypothetical protein K4K58_007112 [Colletotrichum sp. SAR11_239]|nr:hypothetical protein K4K58_007112 [Colletotrichum sp. SAR11_239]
MDSFSPESRAAVQEAFNALRGSIGKALDTDPPPNESFDKENDVERVLHESHKVLRRYNALNKNFKLLKAEYQKQKDLIKQWGEYSTSLEAKIKRIEDRHGQSIDPTPAFESASEPSRPRAAATPSFTADPGVEPDQANGIAEPQLAAQPDLPADPPRDEGNLPSGHTSDRDTTESGKDADEQTLPPLRQNVNVTTEVFVKSEPSSDGPIFVSERSVGKRKRADDQVTDQTTRTRIKIESSGLSNSLPSTQIQESMDLDELGPRVTTPRRKRHADLERDKSFNSVTVRPDNISTPAAKPLQNFAVLTPVNPNVMPVHPQEKKAVENPTRKGLAQGIRSLAEDGLTYKKTGREEPAGLRSKPVADLRMGDFKINPKFNGGADYAYSEVVRGNDRSCLPGCTDMNCCGPHFRAMALAQKNSADRTAASDNKLFEDFLGDRISTVWGMSKPEKENLWVEAKTWQLANELGKHRHRRINKDS